MDDEYKVVELYHLIQHLYAANFCGFSFVESQLIGLQANYLAGEIGKLVNKNKDQGRQMQVLENCNLNDTSTSVLKKHCS